MINQRTLAKKIELTGIGLHSGKKVTLNMMPAKADNGVTFQRVDLKDSPIVKADATTVGATENNTTLGHGVSAIHTVEHLMASLYGLGINNVHIEINGPEVPIMDGSGASFVFVLKETGVRDLNATKKFLIITEPVAVEHDGKWAKFEPSEKLLIDSTIVFSHPAIKSQVHQFEFSCANFIDQIARARTFGMLKDVDMLKRKGLVKGGSLDNAIVLDDYKVMNPEGLRFQDEFVRHKILDTLGDISLLGYEIIGKITTYKSGHYLHNQLCRKLLENPNSYEVVSASALKEDVAAAHSLPSFIPLID